VVVVVVLAAVSFTSGMSALERDRVIADLMLAVWRLPG
jgi:hypothetical protein